MKGFTLIELLIGISFLTPVESGFLMGKHAGIFGATIGLLVGLVVAILWILVFTSWLKRNFDKLKTSPLLPLTVIFMMIALPFISGIITHQLTTPFSS